jgi:hypothetical protein
VFIAGQSITGQVAASSRVLSGSSAMPPASFPRMLAVAGATTTASDCWAQSMCRMAASGGVANISSQTGSPERAAKVVGPTNRVALRVMTTGTRAPAVRSKRSSSTLL